MMRITKKGRRTVGELHALLGGAPDGQGLLMSVADAASLALWYLDVQIDRDQGFSERLSLPETEGLDPELMGVLDTLLNMSVGAKPADSPVSRFVEGRGRAFIGYSEDMYAMGEAADSVDLHRFSLWEDEDVPM